MQAFLRDNEDYTRASVDVLPPEVRPVVGPDGWLRCLPHRHDTDGFFAARLERRR